MSTLIMKRTSRTVTLPGAPGAQAVAALPDSSQFRGFSILITGFPVAKSFSIQGSFDGVSFFDLDSTSLRLGSRHMVASAAPTIVCVELAAPLPGGLRVVSIDSDLDVSGVVEVMMYNSVINRGSGA